MRFPKAFDTYLDAWRAARRASRGGTWLIPYDPHHGAYSVYEYNTQRGLKEDQGLFVVNATFWGSPHHCNEILRYRRGELIDDF